jgi:Na+-transporting methylmalonyl-CoA/oxaloacetate decarboxylase gamma subunit
MSETFQQALVLSAIGLAMVFGALLLLWALIAVLTRLRWPSRGDHAQENPSVLTELQTPKAVATPSSDELAAIGVALALMRAEREVEPALRKRLPPVLTRWVAVGYGRRLQPWQPPRIRRRE